MNARSAMVLIPLLKHFFAANEPGNARDVYPE